jgi:hypothetical protein
MTQVSESLYQKFPDFKQKEKSRIIIIIDELNI